MRRAEIALAAREWVDVPYRKRGRSPQGIDCIGLVVMLGRRFEIPHVDEPYYTDWPDPERRLLRVFTTYLRRAPVHSPLLGTVGIFAGNILPCHTGVFSELHGQPHVIHARLDLNRVIEQAWRPGDGEGRLVARFMFPGLED